MNRTCAREQAFIFIFEKSFHEEQSMESILDAAREVAEEGSMTEGIPFYPLDDFALSLVNGVDQKTDKLDEVIGKYAIGWKVGRLPHVALAVLRLAIYEMLYVEEIPIRVSINEAVELCKKYATKEDASFINGVLGGVARAQEQEVPAQ